MWKRWILERFDFFALSFALWASFDLRFGQWSLPNSIEQFLLIFTAPLVAIPIVGTVRALSCSYPISARASPLVNRAGDISLSVCWVLFVFIFQLRGYTTVPRIVPILYWALSTMAVGSSRFIAERILWSGGRGKSPARPIAIFGAGEAGPACQCAVPAGQ